jgi:hypothetical protein
VQWSGEWSEAERPRVTHPSTGSVTDGRNVLGGDRPVIGMALEDSAHTAVGASSGVQEIGVWSREYGQHAVAPANTPKVYGSRYSASSFSAGAPRMSHT